MQWKDYKGLIQTAMITQLCKRISADWFQEIIVTDLSKVMTGTFLQATVLPIWSLIRLDFHHDELLWINNCLPFFSGPARIFNSRLLMPFDFLLSTDGLNNTILFTSLVNLSFLFKSSLNSSRRCKILKNVLPEFEDISSCNHVYKNEPILNFLCLHFLQTLHFVAWTPWHDLLFCRWCIIILEGIELHLGA